MYNHTVDLPDLFVSEHIPALGLNLTPKEHPIDNKVMFWLHECKLVIPEDEGNVLILWLSTIIEYVFGKDHNLYQYL